MNCKANKLNSNRLLLFLLCMSLSLSCSLDDASSCVSCRTATFFVTSMPFLTHYQFFSCLTLTFKYSRKFSTFGLCRFSVIFTSMSLFLCVSVDYHLYSSHYTRLLSLSTHASFEIIKTSQARSKEMEK